MSRLGRHSRMFPDRCTVVPIVKGPPDASGGRGDTWPTTSAEVPCRYDEANADDIAQANAQGVKIESKVYFPDSPGDLRPGSKINLTLYRNVAPARPVTLSVTRLAGSGLGTFIDWRADCLGRP